MSTHKDPVLRPDAESPAGIIEPPSATAPAVSRRGFLHGLGGAGVLAASGLGSGAALVAPAASMAEEIGPLDRRTRRIRAYLVRSRAARNLARPGIPEKPANNDEATYADRRASFVKALPQDSLGEVDPTAYQKLLDALETGDPNDFEAIPLSPVADFKLANPLAAYAFEMTGGDGHSSRIAAAPAFASARMAAEMAEVYWQALTRDVPFADYPADPAIAAAAADLSALTSVLGPTDGGVITPATLFRGETPGDLVGPYLSQFLWLEVPYGPTRIDQRYARPVAGDDFLTDFGTWLAIQRGARPAASITFDATPRYLCNNRALGEWVHGDVSFQAYLNAALVMIGFGGAALSERNPYSTSATQGGFITFGGVQIVDLVTKAASVALKTAWYQKWLVHRRLRPEVFAGRVDIERRGLRSYGIHADIFASDAVDRLLAANGNALLPVAFPEGSPTHPAYPAGHAAIAGACCTVLKAFFRESFVIPAPVEASADGLSLDPWTGDDLTLGGEINKLAANVSLGRDAAGVHYRSDGIEGIYAGEQVAIDMLRDYSIAFTERFDGFELTRFDGQRILVAEGQVSEL